MPRSVPEGVLPERGCVGQLTTDCSILNHSCPLIGNCWYRYSLTWFAIPLTLESLTIHFLIPSKRVIVIRISKKRKFLVQG